MHTNNQFDYNEYFVMRMLLSSWYGWNSIESLLTDFVCLCTYEFWLSLWKIVWSSVILLLPLFNEVLMNIKYIICICFWHILHFLTTLSRITTTIRYALQNIRYNQIGCVYACLTLFQIQQSSKGKVKTHQYINRQNQSNNRKTVKT
jgi:hypothetical protein